jgi:hypothetical protein
MPFTPPHISSAVKTKSVPLRAIHGVVNALAVLFVLAAFLALTGCSYDVDNAVTRSSSGGTPVTPPTPVTFSGLTADGSATATTTKLTLTFNAAITGLSAGDITITANGTGTTAGTLMGSGPTYELTVNGISAGGTITVGVAKAGYAITQATRTVSVFRYTSPDPSVVIFSNLTADGSATVTTTKLTLTFSAVITGLTETDITITPGSTGTTRGTLKSIGSAAYELTVSGITAGGQITVGVAKVGYAISPASKPVTVMFTDPHDLKTRFSVSTASAAFAALHTLIQVGNVAQIALGDYIDLPSLTVAGYPADDATVGYGKISTANQERSGHGRLLRLIVVGINSFKRDGAAANNTIAPDHVVFQFQNVPVTRRMEATGTNANGYLGSEMREYLVPVAGVSGSGNFLTGLKAATGLTDAMLWGPTRKVANKGQGVNGTHTVTDTLWLPTEWEMFGVQRYSSQTYEVNAGQARLEYYATGNAGDTSRIKYDSSNNPSVYWTASPDPATVYTFAYVSNYGFAGYTVPYSDRGCAPAFCVK